MVKLFKAPCNITSNNIMEYNVSNKELECVRYKCGKIKWKRGRMKSEKEIKKMIKILTKDCYGRDCNKCLANSFCTEPKDALKWVLDG